MEAIHGVDVSWLHHSQKDHNHRPKAKKGQQTPPPSSPRTESEPPPLSQEETATLDLPGSNGHSHLFKPHLGRNGSAEKTPQVSAQSVGGEKMAGNSPSPSPSPSSNSPSSNARRGSWLGGLTSKFSSVTPVQPAAGSPSSPSPRASAPPYGRRASLSEGLPEPKDETTPYTPAAPKSGHSSFLSTAFRRLSSSAGPTYASARSLPRGGICERRVMNKDPERERSKISELDQSKLRRVAFCVDVEIAGGPHYSDGADGGAFRAPVKKPDHQDTKLKEKGEGEALKHPEKVKEEKENEGEIKVDGETVEETATTSPTANEETTEPPKEESRKKQKKKKSEEERKERKEKKRRQAEANGSIPMETVINGDSPSPGSSSPGSPTASTHDRPTMDPLRIYKRCCQLRESPALKKVVEQLTMAGNSPAQPGIVASLDLSGYWMQLDDIVTLSDWLAVVPIKKVILENCGLTDEAVRLILSGLLAAKVPPASHHWEHHSDKHHLPREEDFDSGLGLEKLVLKNNPKIGPEGWKHISLFLHLCRSVKAIDLSLIPIKHRQAPKAEAESNANDAEEAESSKLLSKAILERYGSGSLEELVMSECKLNTADVTNIVDAAESISLKRLGLANNNLNKQGLERVAVYLKSGKCEGLDLGGNSLTEHLPIIVDAIEKNSPLWALSLADCNLTSSLLSRLFPVLAALPSCRFIDLSHNKALFGAEPTALSVCRRYLPKFALLKRFHLADVSMTPEHAVALAEILPECKTLAHFSILENPQVTALAHATDEATKEEACALYASLMAAVRVSSSIVCVDVDIPAPESSEIVKALAKQVVAYSLRNMERGTISDVRDTATDAQGGKEYALPDVLMHIVGHDEVVPEHQDVEEPAPDDDYVIGGTGVVKALSICLGSSASDSRRASRDNSAAASGSATPKATKPLGGNKPRDMSKTLLSSARKIRRRIQPALARESKDEQDMDYRRLIFLDQTLEGIIHRFEDEYPECRTAASAVTLPREASHEADLEGVGDRSSVSGDTLSLHSATSEPVVSFQASPMSDGEETFVMASTRPMERHPSDVSIASKALSDEEGRMHRLGQHVRQHILKTKDSEATAAVKASGKSAEDCRQLKEKLAAMPGDELRQKIETLGTEGTMKALGASIQELRLLAQDDPEAFESFKLSQLMARENVDQGTRAGLGITTKEGESGEGNGVPPTNGEAQ